MTCDYNHVLALLLCLILFLLGCQGEASEDLFDRLNPIEIDDFALFIDFDHDDPDALASPAAIEMLPAGEIAVLDNQLNEVLVYTSDGEMVRRFGGRGQGPGELLDATYMQPTNDRLHVFDVEQRRMSQFTYAGEFEANYTFDINIRERRVASINSHKFALAARGENGHLLRLVDASNDSTHYFGKAIGEAHQPADMDEERNRLQRGEIPSFYMNDVTLYSDSDHLYAYLDAHSRLQKYSIDGELIWEASIDLSSNDAIFETAVMRAREEDSPGAVPHYQFITSMNVVNGKTYLLSYPADDHPRYIGESTRAGRLTGSITSMKTSQ